MQELYHYYRSVFAGVPRPFAFIDYDNLRVNIQDILHRASPLSVRLATKSVRCLPVIKRILQYSPVFNGVMTYSAAETVWLSKNGIDNLLIGYPQTDVPVLTAIAAEIKSGKSITCMVDCEEQVDILDKTGSREQVIFPVCLDVDMSVDYPGLHFGVHRSSLKHSSDVRQLAERIAARKNIRITGLMGYEAEIAGVADNVPGGFFKNRIIRRLKRNARKKIFNKRQECVAALRSAGIVPEFVNGGGTGSIEFTRQDKAVTEITAGSGFFQSHLFDKYTHFRHMPVTAFGLEVSRHPLTHIYTCHGGGYIASGAAGSDKLPAPYLPEGMRLLPLEGAGEVQTPFHYNGKELLQIGDTVFFRHAKAGELSERFSFFYVVSGGKIIDQYPSYRGEGQCFL